MITVKIEIEPAVAEYIKGKYLDGETGVVRFPASSDVYILVYDLLARRPVKCPVDTGNLEFALPDRREANFAGGKDPKSFNYLSRRAAKILEDRLKLLMWAELHEFMDEQKHLAGVQYKDSVFMFMQRYCIESLTEDALLKNYQRWRDRMRRRQKRGYRRG
ncbi:MAG: hypothetical protein K2H87_07650 [Duncaniella sp.]|nr:hypothetical protein [Duncaniella sp.]